ncbi:MAG: glycosyltransferase family 4 protein [Burkholderiaceae bacterium]
MRVAIIEPVGGHGGMNHYDTALCRSVVDFGIAPILYTCNSLLISDHQFETRFPYIGIFGSDPAWKRGLRFLRGSISAMLDARGAGCKVAHFHFFSIGPLELFNVICARTFGLQVVVTAHDVEAFGIGLSVERFVKWAYALSDAIIAHNETSRSALVEKILVSPAKIHVIPAGNHETLSKNAVSRALARERLNLRDEEFTIVFFGQIKKVKGLDILLHAMPEVIKLAGRPVKLIIAGRLWKHGFDEYQKIIDNHHLEKFVSLNINYIPDDDLPNFYRGPDIMVLPYRRIYQSDVALMALTFEIPIVSSDVPGMKEMLTHLKTGILFESDNPSDLARKLLWSIHNPEALRIIIKNGKELAERKYSWSSIGEKTATLYRSLDQHVNC